MSSGCHWQSRKGNFPFLVHCALLLLHVAELIVNYLCMAHPHSTDLSQVPPLAPPRVLLLCPGIVALQVLSLSIPLFPCPGVCHHSGQNQSGKPATTDLIRYQIPALLYMKYQL